MHTRKEFLLKLKIVLFVMIGLLASLTTFAQPDIRSVELLRQNPAYERFFNGGPAPDHIQKARAEQRAKEMSPKGAFDRQAVGDTPIINNQGVVNAFSSVFENRIASGEFVCIYGANFANSGASAPGGNLPTALNGVEVRINNILAALSYVGPGQINAQMPYGLPQFGNSSIVVTVAGKSSSPFTMTNSVVAPVLYKLQNGAVYTQNQSGFPVGTPGNSPLVISGQSVGTTHYASGLGLTNPFVDVGKVTFGAPQCAASMVVVYSSTPVSVGYCGLSPGSVGLGQVNLIWPGATPAGTHTVQLRLGGVDIPAFTVTTSR